MNNIAVLKALVNGTVTTNGTKQITGATLNALLNNMVDNLFTPAGTVRIWPGVIIPMGWSKCDGSVYPQPDHLQSDYADLFNSLGGPASPYGVQATTFNIPLIVGAQNVIQAGISTFHLNIVSTPPYALNDVLTTLSPSNGVAAKFKVIGVGSNFALKMLSSGSGYHAGESYSLRTLDGSLISQMIVIDSAYTLGATGGEESHILTKTEMPSHTHIQDPHNHDARLTVPGSPNDTESNGGPWSYTTTTGDTRATNQNTGGNPLKGNATDPHNNMSPYMAMNYIIKLQ